MFSMNAQLSYCGTHERIDDVAQRLNNDTDFFMILANSFPNRDVIMIGCPAQRPFSESLSIELGSNR